MKGKGFDYYSENVEIEACCCALWGWIGLSMFNVVWNISDRLCISVSRQTLRRDDTRGYLSYKIDDGCHADWGTLFRWSFSFEDSRSWLYIGSCSRLQEESVMKMFATVSARKSKLVSRSARHSQILHLSKLPLWLVSEVCLSWRTCVALSLPPVLNRAFLMLARGLIPKTRTMWEVEWAQAGLGSEVFWKLFWRKLIYIFVS